MSETFYGANEDVFSVDRWSVWWLLCFVLHTSGMVAAWVGERYSLSVTD